MATITKKPRRSTLKDLRCDINAGRKLVEQRLRGNKITAIVTRSNEGHDTEIPDEPRARASMIGKLESVYLAVALDKLSLPPHPNFERALKRRRRNPDEPTQTERMWLRIRSVAAPAYDAYKAGKANVKVVCAQAARLLKDDARCYVQFWKELMKAVSFTAHIEASVLERHVDPEMISGGVDAMLEEHTIEGNDIPLFDLSEADRALLREEYAGGEPRETAAKNLQEVYDAVRYIQAWIGLAFSDFTPDKAAFWGVHGDFPLDQEVVLHEGEETEYKPLRDFDSYRHWRRRQWAQQQRRAPVSMETEELLIGA